ncbi:general stress protein [Paenibacillus humicus]|uniref:general stress protein n=1 Tax=Paenibacillus humicus TaxID=412861 RepID=UPI000FDCAD20
MSKKIVGVYDTEDAAISAIEDLKARGVDSDDISILARDKGDVAAIQEETGTMAPEGVAAGAAGGGVLGGLTGLLVGIGALAIPGIGPIVAAGPIAAALTGAAVGAGAGGLVGGLIGLGIPENEANMYNEYVQDGNILVLVESKTERDHDIYDSLRSTGSINAPSYERDIQPYNQTAAASEHVGADGAVPAADVYPDGEPVSRAGLDPSPGAGPGLSDAGRDRDGRVMGSDRDPVDGSYRAGDGYAEPDRTHDSRYYSDEERRDGHVPLNRDRNGDGDVTLRERAENLGDNVKNRF